MRKLNQSLVRQVILIVVGLIIGVYFSMKANQEHSGHDKMDFHTSMHHGYIDISKDSIIPKLEKLEVTKDPMSGWNLHLKTKHFHFAPEHAGSQHIPGEGHAHLTINGEKVARIYSNWFHIPNQKSEVSELEVTLNANSHATMIYKEKPISIKLEKGLSLTNAKNL